MISLYLNYFVDPDPIRQAELDECLSRNIACLGIDRIHLLVEPQDRPSLAWTAGSGDTVTSLPVDRRPTFADFFRIINERTGDNDVNIVANSDVFMDDTIRLAETHLTPHRCWALTRYENGVLWEPAGFSQDVWCFRGKIKDIKGGADFWLGQNGCDNSLAHRLVRSGYRVLNPCLSVKTHHLHASQVRRSSGDPSLRLLPPYLMVPPCEIGG